ncbi:hypothetical protein, partial [Deinococcus sp.]|uniref:hypothetical protein n=1 Tax=Deinococcus sp. TaxID=47478 RepID=UPI00286998EB
YTDTAGRDLQVPAQFWKLVLRVHNGVPQATVFLVSQRDLLALPRRPMRPGGEGTAPDVTTFLTSIPHLQELTGLDFGSLALYDTFAGPADDGPAGGESAPLRPVTSWADLP